MNRVTIKEVAKAAGVSISTVSNALNDSQLVHEETKAKILEIADKMNYIPNMNGKMLKAKHSKMLGFFSSSVSGAYFNVLVEAMVRECDRRGYALNVIVTRDTRVIMSNILGGNFDGVFIFEGIRIGDDEIALMTKNKVKTVFLDRVYQNKNMSSIVFDSYKAGYEVTRHLINLGHKCIYYIEGAADVHDSAERKKGYQKALMEMGLEAKDEYVICGMFEEKFTYNTVTSLLMSGTKDRPDAFIAGNDHSAIGCIKALQDNGLRVPEDVSVVGFDDIELAEYIQPSLTTVRNPIARQGIASVEMLLDMITENKEGSVEYLEGILIPRNSSGIIQNR